MYERASEIATYLWHNYTVHEKGAIMHLSACEQPSDLCVCVCVCVSEDCYYLYVHLTAYVLCRVLCYGITCKLLLYTTKRMLMSATSSQH